MIQAKLGSLYYRTEKTVLGKITIIWEAVPSFKVKRILLPSYSRYLNEKHPEITQLTTKVVEDLAEDISGFLEGEDRYFDIGVLDLDSCSMFQRKVLQAEYGIPRGWVSTISFSVTQYSPWTLRLLLVPS